MWNILDLMTSNKTEMVAPENALTGRESYPFVLSRDHLVLSTDPLGEGAPEEVETIIVAGGCFWGIERIMWNIEGVWSTAAGYAGGFTPHPTYDEVCTAKTGHAEAVKAMYRGGEDTLRRILSEFWQQHDPTTANRQGNDVGTQYRSAVYFTNEGQRELCERSLTQYQEALTAAGRGTITTEVLPLSEAGNGEFYYAEPEHQQYLAKNPGGYCNHGFNGVACSLA